MPPPAPAAVARLAKLAAAGAAPERMAHAVDDVLVGWAAEGLDDDDLRERVEQLQADLDAGVEAAEDGAAENQAAALRAARDRLAAVIEGRRA